MKYFVLYFGDSSHSYVKTEGLRLYSEHVQDGKKPSKARAYALQLAAEAVAATSEAGGGF
jgi:hypothetical protein